MKKLIRVVLIISMICSVASLAYTADPIETNKTVNVTLNVATLFGFQIWDTEYSQTLEPNGEPYEIEVDGVTVEIDPRLGNIHIYVSANRGMLWSIGAECLGVFEYGKRPGSGYQTPLIITTFGDKLTGTKVEDLELTGASQAIYRSGVDEIYVKGLEVNSIFLAKPGVPLGSGKYWGYLTLTMVSEGSPPNPPRE